MSDDELAYLAGSMFGAGSDTVRYLPAISRYFSLTISHGRLLGCFRL